MALWCYGLVLWYHGLVLMAWFWCTISRHLVPRDCCHDRCFNLQLTLNIFFNDQSNSSFQPLTNKCTGSLQFHVNEYLALLITLLIRHINISHLTQILLIGLCACAVAYPTTFLCENFVLFTVFNWILGKISHVKIWYSLNTCNNRNILNRN